MRNFFKGFITDILSDMEEFVDITKFLLPQNNLITKPLDFCQERLLDCINIINRRSVNE